MGCKVLPKEIGRLERAEPSDPEKAYEIEQLNKLGARMFEGSIDPVDAENWLYMLEKCCDWLSLKGSIPSFHGMLTLLWLLKVTSAEGLKVETALHVEHSITDEKSVVELSHGTSTDSGFRGREQRRFTLGGTPCMSCGKNHRGQCLVGASGVGSQTIGQPRVSVVPTVGTSGARQKGVVGRPRQHGKVYSMTQQEAEDDQTLLLLNRMLEPLSEGLAIYTPVGDVLLVIEVLRNCEVLVEGRKWFSEKPSSLKVVFRGMRKVVFRSLISVLKAKKLLRKGCIAFLAHIIVVQREKLNLEDIPVVKEFLDVFRDDLSGLPPDR
ncbi:putative DNA/RNA polymerases superfamily protein [Cucumis melo var. makuwa]|uniref:DNA/RNA polymerases superfamily protein n=1 Tax=Cucumis melo var. makuwa TaxID=1194695 RepID=A0A5A7TGJ7_CUCMM|nr:putative DNA/RNA polymerases superfamily protein [Cucumis melo var. makuwa]